jgi:hypoxanthine-DNA glycosylase
MAERVQSFPPIVNGNSRVLILGTMPGAESLRQQRYYAYGRNDFWRILMALLGREDLPDYDERVSLLLSRGIAVWDVLHSCERRTSADADIREPVANDIPGLLRDHPGIAAVAPNGKGAERLLRQLVLPQLEHPPQICVLPSTSPAYAIPFQKKLEGWKNLQQFL